MRRRLVVVLGYSDGSARLHPICAARLARAAEIATADDLVLLSGWARRRAPTSEAELMARAWSGPSRVLLDREARSTLGNVVGAVRAALAHDARELVLVTSSWHARRTGALARAAARGTGVHVEIVRCPDPRPQHPRRRALAGSVRVPI
ncbi:MAG: YdcF family protein, partial [Thermoleophilia bacterium]|nr:YdcF family protein [Thermoleophilia bacterium]